jgi:hypothetical protein
VQKSAKVALLHLELGLEICQIYNFEGNQASKQAEKLYMHTDLIYIFILLILVKVRVSRNIQLEDLL